MSQMVYDVKKGAGSPWSRLFLGACGASSFDVQPWFDG